MCWKPQADLMLVVAACGRQVDTMYWYGPHMGGWGWAAGLGGVMFWVLLAVAVIALVSFFIRGGRRPLPFYGPAGGPPPHTQSGLARGPATPEQILAERFARGDIGEEEFRARLAVLRGEAPPPTSPAGSS